MRWRTSRSVWRSRTVTSTSRNAIHPYFDDMLQYAHYFRYRTRDKRQIPESVYEARLGTRQDSPTSAQPLEPEGDDITVGVLEAEHKAQHIAGEGQQMSPGKACPGAGRRRRGNHTQSFCGGAAHCEGVASARCGRHRQHPQR